MAYSRVVAVGDGITSIFSVNFALDYLLETDVTCRVGTEVDGASAPAYRAITFLSTNLLKVSGTIPGAGVQIVFERTVDKTVLRVDYNDGDQLDADNLMIAQKQAMMAVQECFDGLGSVLLQQNFRGIYYGPYQVTPTTDPNGNAIQAGDMYYDLALLALRVYSGGAWQTYGSGYADASAAAAAASAALVAGAVTATAASASTASAASLLATTAVGTIQSIIDAANIPTATNPVIVTRVSTNEWLVLTPVQGGKFGEFVTYNVRDIGPSLSITRCMSLVGQYTNENGNVRVQCDPTATGAAVWEYAMNVGLMSDPLSTWGLVGGGHGNIGYLGLSMNMDGGSNIRDMTVGTSVKGKSLGIGQDFTYKLPQDHTTLLGTISSSHTFSATGCRVQHSHTPTVVGTGNQNSYDCMYPMSGCDTVKFGTNAAFVVAPNSGQGSNQGQVNVVQAWNSDRPDLVSQVTRAVPSPDGWTNVLTSDTFVIANLGYYKIYFNYRSGTVGVAAVTSSHDQTYCVLKAGLTTGLIDVDPTLAANSDAVVPSQKGVKAYITGLLATINTTIAAIQTSLAGKMTGGTASTDGNFVMFNGAAGKTAIDLGLSLSIDGTLAGNSDGHIPTEKAVKTALTNEASTRAAADTAAIATARAWSSFSVYLATSVTTFPSAADTKVICDTKEWDIGTLYSTSTGQWTPPAGKGRVNAACYFSAGVVDQAQYQLTLYKNNVAYKAFDTKNASGTAGIAPGGSVIFTANGTDVFDIRGYGGGAGLKTVLGNSAVTYFQGEMFST